MTWPYAERVLIQALAAHLAPMLTAEQVAAATPENLDELLPFIRMYRVSGSPDLDGALDFAVVDVDVYASNRIAGFELALAVQDWLTNTMRGTQTTEAVIGEPRVIVGPRWLPDANTNLVRVSASYEVPMHPVYVTG